MIIYRRATGTKIDSYLIYRYPSVPHVDVLTRFLGSQPVAPHERGIVSKADGEISGLFNSLECYFSIPRLSICIPNPLCSALTNWDYGRCH